MYSVCYGVWGCGRGGVGYCVVCVGEKVVLCPVLFAAEVGVGGGEGGVSRQ